MVDYRIRLFKLIFILLTLLIVLRLAYWQVLRADDMAAKAESQHQLTKEILAQRGNILFSDKSILAATEPSFLVYAQPRLIDKEYGGGSSDYLIFRKREIAQKLAENLWIENKEATSEAIKSEQMKKLEDGVFDKLSKDLFWISLGKKVDIDVKSRIEKLGIKGIGFDESTSRLYPEGSSSAHLLGFVASDEYGEDKGYFGLEGYYDGELKGKNGSVLLEKDALGMPIVIGKFLTREAKSGKTIVLNIDRTVQHIAEEKLKSGIEKYQAKGGSVVILEPKTGKVLAMAAYPNYDPNDAFSYPNGAHKNPIVSDAYEPGSTFKVLVMAAGINEGVVNPDTVCNNCDGPLQIANFSIRTWNNKYQKNLTMTDTIIHSDNTGMVYVARKLGLDKMYDYIKSFGFGEVTGIDLEDESTPTIRDKKNWQEIDLATASFGQGVSATALQVARAVSAIANGGKLMEPHVVSSIEDKSETFRVESRVKEQPITEQTAKIITQMMVKAVEEGEAKFAKPKGYKIAGKTGTAQIPVQGHYDASKTIASFVGFAPVNDPKFVMLVKYDEPKKSIYGAETAAPTFFDIAKELFIYFGIVPTE